MDFNKQDKINFLFKFLNNETPEFYNFYKRKKKNGKLRQISAPDQILKSLQKELSELLYKEWKEFFDKSPWITGFVPEKSIISNAMPHLKSEWVINLDIEDFFPSVKTEMIKFVISKIPVKTGFWAKIFGIKERRTKFYDLTHDQIIKIATLDNQLPQGSPASPVISNIVAVEVDKVIKDLLSEGWEYTRYADDITISTKKELPREIIQTFVDNIILNIEQKTQFKIKKQKVNIKHRSQRQLVTGIMVNNEEVSISKNLRNKLRAALHQHKINNKKIDDSLLGLLTFIKQVNKQQYEKLTKEFPCNLLT